MTPDAGGAPLGARDPSPDLSPAEVVDAVLHALAARDRPQPDNGVSVLYAFASERMRHAIGDAGAFRRAVRNDRYAPLLGAVSLEVEDLERRDDSARATVRAHGAGVAARFIIALARARHGERRGCWLLSGIAREGIDL